MKSFLKFIAVTAAVLLGSAILAPILVKFLPFKFEKIFNRLIMISTLAAVVAFVRVTPESLARYGLTREPKMWKLIFAGFLGGVGTLLILTFVKLGFGAAQVSIEKTGMEILLKTAGVFFSAFLIGLIEEYFFRGVIFSTLKDKFGWGLLAALIVTSLFYSAVHFVNVQKPFIPGEPTFYDSLKLIAAPFHSFLNWQEFWRAAIGLFLFGGILNVLYLRSGSLYMSIGLHAGCVFFVKTDRYFVDFINDSPMLWGSAKMYDSLAGWVFIALMGIVLIRLIPVIKKSEGLKSL